MKHTCFSLRISNLWLLFFSQYIDIDCWLNFISVVSKDYRNWSANLVSRLGVRRRDRWRHYTYSGKLSTCCRDVRMSSFPCVLIFWAVFKNFPEISLIHAGCLVEWKNSITSLHHFSITFPVDLYPSCFWNTFFQKWIVSIKKVNVHYTHDPSYRIIIMFFISKVIGYFNQFSPDLRVYLNFPRKIR